MESFDLTIISIYNLDKQERKDYFKLPTDYRSYDFDILDKVFFIFY